MDQEHVCPLCLFLIDLVYKVHVHIEYVFIIWRQDVLEVIVLRASNVFLATKEVLRIIVHGTELRVSSKIELEVTCDFCLYLRIEEEIWEILLELVTYERGIIFAGFVVTNEVIEVIENSPLIRFY